MERIRLFRSKLLSTLGRVLWRLWLESHVVGDIVVPLPLWRHGSFSAIISDGPFNVNLHFCLMHRTFFTRHASPLVKVP